MVNYAAYSLDAMLPEQRQSDPGFALMESFLLHYRILQDFLYPKEWPPVGVARHDIYARDYAPAWIQLRADFEARLPPQKTPERVRLNIYLAHLSVGRLDHVWPITEMHARLKSSMDDFRAMLTSPRKEQMHDIRLTALTSAVSIEGEQDALSVPISMTSTASQQSVVVEG